MLTVIQVESGKQADPKVVTKGGTPSSLGCNCMDNETYTGHEVKHAPYRS